MSRSPKSGVDVSVRIRKKLLQPSSRIHTCYRDMAELSNTTKHAKMTMSTHSVLPCDQAKIATLRAQKSAAQSVRFFSTVHVLAPGQVQLGHTSRSCPPVSARPGTGPSKRNFRAKVRLCGRCARPPSPRRRPPSCRRSLHGPYSTVRCRHEPNLSAHEHILVSKTQKITGRQVEGQKMKLTEVDGNRSGLGLRYAGSMGRAYRVQKVNRTVDNC